MNSTIIAFKYSKILKAILLIEDNGSNQVIIRFIPYGDEHYTLHLQDNKQVLLTHYSSNKLKSTWDDATVEIARKMGYKEPERHGKYYQHRPIPFDGYELGGRLVDLNDFSPKAKYQNKINLTFNVSEPKFMLKTFLNSRNLTIGDKINTSLGTIHFEYEYINS
jgi:hypothetical protein